jgi:4-hydroxy-3-polyprenylbenzoate decarboxylase
MKTDPDLRSFLKNLDRRGLLCRISQPVSLVHEITEIAGRVLRARGPALLFEKPIDAGGQLSPIPVLANLFGTTERVALGLGLGIDAEGLGKLGEVLATLREPRPPRSLAGTIEQWPMVRAALSLGTKRTERPPCQAVIRLQCDIDLGELPAQWCWPGEPAPLLTWGLAITRAPNDAHEVNVGVYRMQLLGRDRLIARWLPHRGGARHHRMWQACGQDMPIAIAIGTDPATMLAAAMPLPDGLSELDFAGLLRGEKTTVARGVTVDLPIPASAEIVLEGWVSATEEAEEGPYGDHTGYFNSVERFPVVTLSALTSRANPIYVSTHTGRPPDEPSVLGESFNELFVPIVRRQLPEIRDLWLPPEGCSYRVMVVSIDKRYPGHARRIMMGLWSMLPQFSYVKLIVVVDSDINVRSWPDIVWAISTRFDASRDLVVIDRTPIDYLDFASPLPGLGGKLGIDATVKTGAETSREWGRPLAMNADVVAKVDALWPELGISGVAR